MTARTGAVLSQDWAVLTGIRTNQTRTGTVPTQVWTVPTRIGMITIRTGAVSSRNGTVLSSISPTCEQSFGFPNMTTMMLIVLHILSNVDSVDQNNFHFFEDIRVKILFRKVPSR